MVNTMHPYKCYLREQRKNILEHIVIYSSMRSEEHHKT